MKLSDMALAKAMTLKRQAPQTKPEPPSPQTLEASGISSGTRSDKKPFVRKPPRGVSGLPIWRIDGK